MQQRSASQNKISNDQSHRRPSLAARSAVLAPRLSASAQELVDRGAFGVAARILVPELDAPILITAGHADGEGRVRLTGDELFPIASQSKLLIAALVLILERQGKIGFDDALSRYVHDAPAVDADATIDQLLNHTSGIGNFIHSITSVPDPLPRLAVDDLMSMARVQGRQSAPGERFDYNNTDALVLAKICEQVTGKPRHTLLREAIFEPLGMGDTMVGFGDGDRRSCFAKGYYEPSSGQAARVDVTEAPDLSIASAAGDITSSLKDMASLFDALRNPSNPTGLTIDDFIANVVDVGRDGQVIFTPRTFGRGAECWLWGGAPAWGHRGSIFGYHSATFLQPRTGVVLSMFVTVCTKSGPGRFIDVQTEGFMRFIDEAMTMMIDAAELP